MPGPHARDSDAIAPGRTTESPQGTPECMNSKDPFNFEIFFGPKKRNRVHGGYFRSQHGGKPEDDSEVRYKTELRGVKRIA